MCAGMLKLAHCRLTGISMVMPKGSRLYQGYLKTRISPLQSIVVLAYISIYNSQGNLVPIEQTTIFYYVGLI